MNEREKKLSNLGIWSGLFWLSLILLGGWLGYAIYITDWFGWLGKTGILLLVIVGITGITYGIKYEETFPTKTKEEE